MMKIHKAVLVALFVSVALFGCVTEEGARKHGAKDGSWEATLYAVGGDAVETFGPYTSRDECVRASMEHLGADDRHDQSMAFSCAMK